MSTRIRRPRRLDACGSTGSGPLIGTAKHLRSDPSRDGPLGPVFVSADEIPDPQSLRIQTWVNGELRQNAPCSDMLFKIPELIEFITRGITLQPGDLIATGTPSGVGLGFTPPKWLVTGDRVEVSIEPIGTLRSVIID